MKKPTENALMSRELIEVEGGAEYTQRFYLQLNVDNKQSLRSDSHLGRHII